MVGGDDADDAAVADRSCSDCSGREVVAVVDPSMLVPMGQ